MSDQGPGESLRYPALEEVTPPPESLIENTRLYRRFKRLGIVVFPLDVRLDEQSPNPIGVCPMTYIKSDNWGGRYVKFENRAEIFYPSEENLTIGSRISEFLHARRPSRIDIARVHEQFHHLALEVDKRRSRAVGFLDNRDNLTQNGHEISREFTPFHRPASEAFALLADQRMLGFLTRDFAERIKGYYQKIRIIPRLSSKKFRIILLN